MTLKTIATGSTGNCYILTSDSGKHLILDAGIPIAEIKKGLDFDIENTVACICTHVHKDHSLSANKLKKMGIPVWQPYLSDHKRQKTHLGEFECESFELPHNGCPNVGYLIRVGGQVIAYMTDMEYCGWDLSKQNINVMLIEMNYQKDRIDGNSHMTHVVLGHAEEQTTIEVIKHNMKHLRTVILCHMSNSGALDRELAMQRIKEAIPAYIEVEFAKENTVIDLSEIPF